MDTNDFPIYSHPGITSTLDIDTKLERDSIISYKIPSQKTILLCYLILDLVAILLFVSVSLNSFRSYTYGIVSFVILILLFWSIYLISKYPRVNNKTLLNIYYLIGLALIVISGFFIYSPYSLIPLIILFLIIIYLSTTVV